ncbi:hypothetical protein PGTUg99_016214 [Puccinia graminis f. sp. tritici]|uniref:Uncharacterized protein n=1 Tax=Puccinia graminis f. sp. tritici TaxID=56615 RepID=A0A5B0MV39_PUCGR|nr:hypothetical protein PGTUg99_016214 [Puccinia graminis f. sp. tritici]
MDPGWPARQGYVASSWQAQQRKSECTGCAFGPQRMDMPHRRRNLSSRPLTEPVTHALVGQMTVQCPRGIFDRADLAGVVDLKLAEEASCSNSSAFKHQELRRHLSWIISFPHSHHGSRIITECRCPSPSSPRTMMARSAGWMIYRWDYLAAGLRVTFTETLPLPREHVSRT